MKISWFIFLRMRTASDNICRERKHLLYSITFFPANHAVYSIMWQDSTQMTMQYETSSLNAGSLMLQCYRHKLKMFNNYCLPIVTMATRTRTSVNLYLHHLFFSFNSNVRNEFCSHPPLYSMSTSRSFPGFKMGGMWRWQITSTYYGGIEWVELYHHFPICFLGVNEDNFSFAT